MVANVSSRLLDAVQECLKNLIPCRAERVLRVLPVMEHRGKGLVELGGNVKVQIALRLRLLSALFQCIKTTVELSVLLSVLALFVGFGQNGVLTDCLPAELEGAV